MNKRWVSKLMLASLIALSATPVYGTSFAAESGLTSDSAIVEKYVTFRSAPSINASKIGTLAKGQKVQIIEQVNSYWFKVQDEKQRVGYVSAKGYLTVGSSTPVNQPITAVNKPTESISSGSVQAVINAGMKYLGTPYEFGSDRNTITTFDCSDFVRQAFLEGVGVKLPADSRQQGEIVRSKGKALSNWRDLKPGDVMFFMSYKGSNAANYNVDKTKERITHDGIYLGNGKILHTYSKESGGVRIDSIEGTHWEKRFLFGGSVI